VISVRPKRARWQRAAVRLALAAGLGLGAMAAAQGWLESRSPASPVAVLRMADVLVSARTIDAGEVLAPADVRWQPWPADAIAPSWQVRGRNRAMSSGTIAGMVAPMRMAAGVPVTPAMLAAPGSGSAFAAAIRPGWRAVSIAVTPAAGLAGFVTPGDRVDVMLTQVLGNRRTGQTLLTGLTVLGVDRRQRGHDGYSAPIETAGDVVAEAAGASGAAPPGLVTLEVTPRQAETLVVAAEMGKLSLLLRGPGAEPTSVGGRRWDSDVTGLPAAMLAAGGDRIAVEVPAAPTLAAVPPAVHSGGVDIVYGLPQASEAAK
jgi:pilus assembly protein CpaB